MDARKIFGIALLGGLGYVGYKKYFSKPSASSTGAGGTTTTTSRDPSCLGDAYQDGAGLSQMVIAKLNPIVAGAVEQGVRYDMGDQAQSDAFEAALFVATSEPDLNRDEQIRKIVSEFIAPHCDWASPLPYAYTDPQFQVWNGTGLILDLAKANLAVSQGA